VQWDFIDFNGNGLTTNDFINYLSLPFTVESGSTSRGAMSGIWRGINFKYGNTQYDNARLGGNAACGTSVMNVSAEYQGSAFSGSWNLQATSGCYMQAATLTYFANA